MAGFPQNILIIDDDIAMLEIEELALKRVGDIVIESCESYDQAVSALQGFDPDIILLDLRMPGKNGPDILEEFRQMDKLENTPVIFVTGEHKVTMQDNYKQLGVIGIIHKPFKPSDLVMNIQRFWQAHRFAADE